MRITKFNLIEKKETSKSEEILDDNYFPKEKQDLHFGEILGITFLNIIGFLTLYFIFIYVLVVHVIIMNNTDDDYLIKYLSWIVPSSIFVISFLANYASGSLSKKRRKKWVFSLTFIFIAIFAYYEIFVMQFAERFF